MRMSQSVGLPVFPFITSRSWRRNKVKVVLTGEGSDELFAGYGRYRISADEPGAICKPTAWLRKPFRLSTPHRRFAMESLLPACSGAESAPETQTHRARLRGNSLQSLYLENFYGAFSSKDVEQLLGPATDASAAYRTFTKWFDSVPGLPYLERLLYADKKTYLVELLMKQDQMSMAASIESRVPFLDHTFVEFASQIPPNLKLRGKVGKYILKEAIADLLPASIVHRKKMGFPTPLKQWLLDPSAAPLYDFLLEKDSLLAEHIDRPALTSLLTRHRNGSEDATDRIWNLLNLQLWGDIFLRGRRARWADGMFPAIAA